MYDDDELLCESARDASGHISSIVFDISDQQQGSDGGGILGKIKNGIVVAGATEYIYDAGGNRVAKGTLSGSTFTPTNVYLLGLGGEQVSEVDGSGNWLYTNAYAGGKQLATYDPNGLHFHFDDWLGTRRLQAAATGTVEESCQSLPFGDSVNCFSPSGGSILPGGLGADTTEQHFTGKIHDAESGLDYFGARYYGSSLGHWTSPDWSAKTEPVPYAKLESPQSLNLYAYVSNNPVTGFDPDGHLLSWSQFQHPHGHTNPGEEALSYASQQTQDKVNITTTTADELANTANAQVSSRDVDSNGLSNSDQSNGDEPSKNGRNIQEAGMWQNTPGSNPQAQAAKARAQRPQKVTKQPNYNNTELKPQPPSKAPTIEELSPPTRLSVAVQQAMRFFDTLSVEIIVIVDTHDRAIIDKANRDSPAHTQD